MLIATLSLAACINTHDTLHQEYANHDKMLQEQCLAQLQTLQQTSVPLYFDREDEPVYRDLPPIETFHCSMLPSPSPSNRELNKRKP